MKRLKLFFACLLMAVLSIGQVWGAISTNSTWTATALADIPDGSTVIILNARGMAISNATVTKSPAKVEASYSTTTKKISVTTSGKSLDDIAWTTQNGTNGTKFWVYGSTTNLLGLSKLNDNNAVAVNVTTTAIYSEFVMGANGNLLEAMNGANRGGRFVGEYVSGSDWRSYNSEAANNYKSGSAVPALTFYVLDAGDPPAPTVCETPTFNPEGGEFSTNSIDVEIATTTDDATIYYTLDGNTPTTSSSVYSSAISLTETTTIKAIAVKEGLSNSEEATATYTKVAPFAGSILEITKTDFTTVSYDDNAGDHEKDGVTFTTAKVYQSGSSIQFQKTNGLLYNKTDLGEIAKIEITTYTGKANNLVVYAGTSENPSSTTVTGSASGSVTTYTFASGNGYFAIKCNGTGASNVDPIKIYYTGTVTVKQDAGLAYAEADQKNLIKYGAAFTAPTLSTADGFDGTVTYASSDEAVVKVNENTGAITEIVAAGKAVITAHSDETENFKEGSASYTICVTNHAGTEVDPFDVADAKNVIDAFGTKENAYVSGIVSSIYSTALGSGGDISFYISADGATTGQQLEAYKCLSLNSEAFTALSDVETGATVVITGTLKKYNSTYELDANCHLVSYEAPAAQKQSIANDQANPYTVAQALVYAADGITYDLDDFVYVRGVVYDVKSFNNGAMNIFIKDANAENQFELYKCAGINDGNATTPFEALTDVQAGDIVIGYGQLTVYNNVSEFKQGNYLVDLDRPAVAVTGVELNKESTSLEVGETETLVATISPENATNKAVTWSSNDETVATVEDGVVTAVGAGTATITVTTVDGSFTDDCEVTVTAADPTKHVVTFIAGTDKSDETSITKDGITISASTFNNDNYYQCYASSAMTVSSTVGNITKIELTCTAEGTVKYGPGNWDFTGYSYSGANGSWTGSAETVEFGTATQQVRMTLVSVTYKEDNRAAAGLAWDPAEDIELTVGDAFTAPSLTYAQGFDGVDDVEISSDNESVAKVVAGVVELVADATGEANITATFAGNDNYKAATASYKITVNASVVPPTPAVSGNVVIIAEYNSKFYAMTNSLGNGALAGVEVEKDGSNIVVANQDDKDAIQWTATVTGDNTTLKDANDKYIKGSDGASLSLDDAAYNWNWDGEKSCYISSEYTTRGLFFSNSGNVFKGYALSNITGNGYAATEVIEIDPENIVISSKVDPQLAYTPASDEITIGDDWSAPALGYVEGFDGLEAISYESSNEAVATVSDAGVIALAGGTGTATITATFGGNTNYLAGSATYTVKVNEPAEDCDGSDDFITATNTSASSYNVERTTTNGWSSVNSALTTINSEARWLTMLGKTSQVGVITSPTLSDGIASLKIRYANTFSESNGASFRVDIKQGEDVVKTFTVTKANSEVTQGTVYTETIEDINVAGEFQIIFTNLCPSAANSNKDRVSIGRLCWTNYEEVTPPTPNYGSYQRNVTEGNYGTICLPQAGTIEGATLFEIGSYENDMIYVDEVGDALEAGVPYIFQATASQLNVTYTSATVEDEAGEDNGLHGFYDLDDENAQKYLDQDAGNYILYQNQYWLVSGRAAYIANNRAYIKIGAIQSKAAAPGRRRVAMAVNGEQVATGMDALNASEQPMKMMIDGKLFIIRGEKMFDATGRLVK